MCDPGRHKALRCQYITSKEAYFNERAGVTLLHIVMKNCESIHVLHPTNNAIRFMSVAWIFFYQYQHSFCRILMNEMNACL